MRKGGKKKLAGLAVTVFWIAMWQLVAMAVDLELLVPAPLTVLSALITNASEARFWLSMFWSLARVLLGFGLGALLGAVLAVLTKISAPADAMLSPVIRMVRATPVASFIILALVWIKSGFLPAFIAMLMVIPVVWGNVYEGIGAVDKDLIEVGKVYKFGKMKLLRLLYIPSVRPYFKAAAITGLGMAWKSGIAAEILCQPKLSIGTGLYYSKLYLETADLFAWTVVVIILSLIVEKLLVQVMKKL